MAVLVTALHEELIGESFHFPLLGGSQRRRLGTRARIVSSDSGRCNFCHKNLRNTLIVAKPQLKIK
jgi:hypothetical protein